MPVEVEARFRGTGTDALARLAARSALGRAVLGPPTSAVEIDRYLDTADARLASARWACRLRSRGRDFRISLKGPPGDGTRGWLHRRPEIEGPASDDVDPDCWPDSEARTFLLELTGGRELRETVRLTQRRVERAVSTDGRAIGTLSLDAVVAESSAAPAAQFAIVELELVADDDPARDLAELARALAAEPGLEPEPRTKLEIALGSADLEGEPLNEREPRSL